MVSGKIHSHKITVVCPFFNEERCIEDSTRKILSILPTFFDSWELILVNDGSTDRSLELLNNINNPSLRIVSSTRNQGRGRALLNGVGFATGQIIVTTEIDLTWGDVIIYELVKNLIDKNLDVVIASPHMPGGELQNVPLKRILLTNFGNLLIRSLTHMKITMSTGMTRAYKASVIKPLQVVANGKEAYLEILLKLYTLNFRIGEIPATIRWNGKGKNGVRKSSTNIRTTILSHLRFLLVAQPKFYFSTIALLTFVAATIFALASIFFLLPIGHHYFC